MSDQQMMINADASSSNSSSLLSSKKYDVFLSFRGEDTRRNFTSHLYEALMQKKVETYIDEQHEKGDEISPALMKAIEDSHVSIVILSENYASSKWCLGELSKILECRKDQGQTIIPVFYKIDPSHVRKQAGSYKQAFAKYEGEPRCSKWKAALTEVANTPGWDSQTFSTESEFLHGIVGDVLQKLTFRYPKQIEGLIGNEENCELIESLLKMGSSEVKTLGIWGMGGIGKTALATALYAKLSREFEGGCFLANIREKSDKHGLKALHNKLFSVLLDNEDHCFDKFDTMSRLRRKKIFVVLDDVATLEQLEELNDYDILGPGSRVIVTTRNKQIFSQVDEIYEVKKLSSRHSLQLFCLIAFREKQLKDGYEDLSGRVISYCKGNPLALKVLGASLRSRSKEAWEWELRKLQKIPNRAIHNVLKLSYDGLNGSEKNIFLDIACFFRGWDRDRVTSLLEACDFIAAFGIKVLLDNALITISYGNRIEMHDLIQEMGWEIVHQECIKDLGRRSRLWKHEEVHDVLKYNRGTDAVEGIILDLCELTQDLYLSSESFVKMTSMRFLKIHGWGSNRFNVYLPNGLESLSDKLRYLRWDGFCLESFPSNFRAECIVELSLTHSKLKKLWNGVQNLMNLKQIDLEDSRDLIEIPNLSKAVKLENISLIDCASLHQLHPSMFSLPKLTYLNLSGCRAIESLNVHSNSLKLPRLDGCSSFKEFSVTSEEMTELDLSFPDMCALSSSIGHSLSLEMLDLSGTNVESLPANIKDLSMLEMLWLDDCRNLVSLPELPPSLYEVSASNCIFLETEISQRLVLQHMLQSCIHHLNPEYNYFILPGDHVTVDCGFHTAGSSITIPFLTKSGFCGFIYCVVLSTGSSSDGRVSCSIYQDGIQVGQDSRSIECKDLILDHVLFWYHDVSDFYGKSVVHDHFICITFKFEFRCGVGCYQERIKGCGVFPVYASPSGLKLASSSSKEIFEWESISQISDDESQPIAIGDGVECSKNEDGED